MFDVRLFGYTCPYSCRTCSFNTGSSNWNRVSLGEEATEELSRHNGTAQHFCSRRQMKLACSSGMLCESYALRDDEIEEAVRLGAWGPVYTLAGNLGSGDKPIPQDDGALLQQGDTNGCVICGLRSYGLIVVEKNGSRFDFCSTAHYLGWWRSKNDVLFNFFARDDTPALETDGQPRVVLFEQEPAWKVVARNSSLEQKVSNFLRRLARAFR